MNAAALFVAFSHLVVMYTVSVRDYARNCQNVYCVAISPVPVERMTFVTIIA